MTNVSQNNVDGLPSAGAESSGLEKMPVVSVVIPAYNAAGSIKRALDSVFSQTYGSFEVIVVNDGSPDTEQLESAISAYSDRVRYLKQENRGPGGARNAGILAALGKYVAFLDSDDTWLPGHLSQQIAMLNADSSLDLVYADSVLMRDGKWITTAFASEPQHPPVTFEKLLTEECTIGTSSTVTLRRAVIDAGLFDERFRCCEDFDLWLRMAFRGARMEYHSAPHLLHNLWAGSLSSNGLTMKRARIEVYKKAVATLPVSSAQRALIHRLIARNEAECYSDLTKLFLRAREYPKALDAARRASTIKRGWRMWLAVSGLRTWPWAFRFCHIAYEWILKFTYRVRRRAIQTPATNSGVQFSRLSRPTLTKPDGQEQHPRRNQCLSA